MVYENEIKGHFVKLRSITLEDAEFSYNLRKDPRFVSIMGQPAATLEDQVKFIEWQMKQPGDYYFVVYDNDNNKIGLIGVYDISGKCGEIGRTLNVGSPEQTMETSLLLHDFAMKTLKLEKVTFVVYKQNKQQLSFHKKLGAEPIREVLRSGIPSYEYEVNLLYRDKYMDKIRKMLDKLVGNK